jgi:hypothetical protein
MIKKVLKGGIGVLAGALLIAQFIQPERVNPPADPSASFEAVAAPSRDVAAAIGRSCRDCHSNQTSWPWYSRISPVSWLIADDVKEGRAKLNFSQWNARAIRVPCKPAVDRRGRRRGARQQLSVRSRATPG